MRPKEHILDLAMDSNLRIRNNWPCASYVRRTIVILALILTIVVGCNSPNDASKRDLAIWRPPDIALAKRMQAASRLVPVGTKQAEAERLLGQPAHQERWHGPSVTISWGKPSKPSAPAGYHNSWHDLYDFKNGDYIDLTFDIEASPSKWEDRPLMCISGGNTNGEPK